MGFSYTETHMEKKDRYVPKLPNPQSDTPVTHLKGYTDKKPKPLATFDLENKAQEYGVPPIIVKLHGCDRKKLKGRESMYALLSHLAIACGVKRDETKVELTYLMDVAVRNKRGYKGEARFPRGYIEVSTFPQDGTAEVDIRLGKMVDRATILWIVRDHFKAEETITPHTRKNKINEDLVKLSPKIYKKILSDLE